MPRLGQGERWFLSFKQPAANPSNARELLVDGTGGPLAARRIGKAAGARAGLGGLKANHADFPACSGAAKAQRRLPILGERFQGLSTSQIMATFGISKDFWPHTPAFQEILAEGREDGLEQGRRQARTLDLRPMERRCGAIGADTRRRLEAFNVERIVALALVSARCSGCG